MRRTLIVGLALITGALGASACRDGEQAPARRSDSVTQDRALTVDGEERSYRLFAPPELPAEAPLVIVMHGMGGAPEQIEAATSYDEMAKQAGFLVAYPAGKMNSWNAGQTLTGGANSDDVKFLVSLVADVAAEHGVDRRRVYLTGHSAGGWMAYRAGCERADVFAAAVPVSTTLLVLCKPVRPLPVLQIHGESDQVIGINVAAGGAEEMRKANGCPAIAVVARDGPTTANRYAPCRGSSEVVFVSLAGVEHVWPLAAQGYSATERGWEFFSRHSIAPS